MVTWVVTKVEAELMWWPTQMGGESSGTREVAEGERGAGTLTRAR